MKYVLQVPASLSIGGVEKVARDIGIYADKSLYEIHYIVFNEKIGEYEQELIDRGCRIFHLQEPSNNYKKFMQELKHIMSITKYDVVHAHTMFNIGWIMLVAKQMKVPVRIAHAHSALNNGGGLKVKVYEKIMRFLILHNATHFVACGEKAGVRLFGEKKYRKDVTLILNGIDIDVFQYDEMKKNRIKKLLNVENKFVMGHVGHLLPVKNQKFLIELMPEILKRKPDAILLLLGEGPDRERLEQKIKDLNLQNQVIMTGNVANVNDYLNAMDVFAFPSIYEGMPLSIIEVQANGLPCILSTNVPKDVYLTDLIQAIELEKTNDWITAICDVRRKNSEKYVAMLKDAKVDVHSMMQKIYNLY